MPDVRNLLSLACSIAIVMASHAFARQDEGPQEPPQRDRLRQFDVNGDGKIDDEERRAVREKVRQMRERPGARTPSRKTEQIGDREVTEMEYPSSDGRKIPCVLSMPKGDGPFPMLVTIHGGQGDRDMGFLRSMAAPGGLSPTVSAFNEQPWAILAVSYRAGNGALFGMEQDDVIAGIRFAKTLPRIDAARVGVVGGSHGGHLALVAAEKMGKDITCVAVGSPWMTDPVVYMTGDPAKPPLSLVPAEAREDIVQNGKRIFNGLLRGRGMSDAEAREFIAGHSIEANAHKILVPSLFITSKGDDQAPHVLIEPTIERMKNAGRDVTVYTAEKSPHGFYWARTVSAARELRGEKTAEEAAEERIARETMIGFFTKHFSRTSAASAAEKARGGSPARGVPKEPAPVAPRTETAAARDGTVRVAAGEVAGFVRDGVRVFLGVPYAAPPVGELRWKAPQPPKPWKGVRKADAFGAPALQGEAFYPRSTQSEDCLSLNIWAPADAQPDAKLPILVWIHGGAFIQGSGAQPRYDGTELAKRGAIVITINYRLGPLGLFAHPALTAEAGPDDPLGNLCLLDMMAALRWTRENIAAFGGDPGNVTISGSSAGGTSCLFLMGIPEAQGLFHKAVIHSSGGIRNIKTLAEAEEAGQKLAARLGLGADASAAELRKLDARDVAVATGVIQQLALPVKPIIDGRLVTQTPSDTFAGGKQARIPVLMGGANGESGARQLGDEVATGGAFGFQRQLADSMARDGQKVFMFQFTFVPPAARQSRSVAMHGEPVAYAFGTIGQSTATQYGFRSEGAAERAASRRRGGGAAAREDDSQPVEGSAEGRRISEAMMGYIVAFMRTGVPAVKGLPEWPAYSKSAPSTMVFGNAGITAK
jgi:para-nitrobenzyl esterase